MWAELKSEGVVWAELKSEGVAWAELKSEGVSWAELKSEGVSWAELKSDEHLLRSPTKQRHLMPFHSPSAVLNHDRDLL